MYDDSLNAVFAALADPTRRDILLRLSNHDHTVNELAEPYDMSLPAISKHLKILGNAGLVSRTKQAQFRPCRLEASPLKAVSEWLETYRNLWDQNTAEDVL